MMTRFAWSVLGFLGFPGLGMLNMLLSQNTANLDPGVLTYLITHSVDGASTRTWAQLRDATVFSKFREDFPNGSADQARYLPPPPGDGCYGENCCKITLPTFVIADDTNDVTVPQDIRNIYDRLKKTRSIPSCACPAPPTRTWSAARMRLPPPSPPSANG